MELLINKNTGSEREIVYFRTDLDNSQILVEHVSSLLDTGNYEVIKRDDI